MYKYQNYEKLSKYFNKLALTGKPMPNMPIINEKTGVSTSTISRYAVKRGYYSFPAMRASFNELLSDESFKDYGFLKLVSKLVNKRVLLLTSISTRIIGLHLESRFKDIGINANYIEHKHGKKIAVDSIGKKDVVVFTSITGESNWYSEIKNIPNKVILITTSKVKEQENREYIVIKKYSPKTTSYYDKNNAVIKLLKWLDSAMNTYLIERKATKK